jgi:hypothetical protein
MCSAGFVPLFLLRMCDVFVSARRSPRRSRSSVILAVFRVAYPGVLGLQLWPRRFCSAGREARQSSVPFSCSPRINPRTCFLPLAFRPRNSSSCIPKQTVLPEVRIIPFLPEHRNSCAVRYHPPIFTARGMWFVNGVCCLFCQQETQEDGHFAVLISKVMPLYVRPITQRGTRM